MKEILEAASEHASRLAADIPLASTRAEHVRVTARANEAADILGKLKFFMNGEAASDGEV